MAGHDQGDRIGGARSRDGARPSRGADRLGHLGIRTGLPRRNGAEILPNAVLERSSPDIQGNAWSRAGILATA
jgi:hypothetical protein